MPKKIDPNGPARIGICASVSPDIRDWVDSFIDREKEGYRYRAQVMYSLLIETRDRMNASSS